ncbi:MAG: TetR/AcrR family transcriptional regulator C-terminal ligand-binding domain-containing protein, partial [Mycobacterium sp.]|nr:TetR/AcrR family transcriptional regulator C-terminal ligand-binding domain-containing protein [Mycobacterium sp.]
MRAFVQSALQVQGQDRSAAAFLVTSVLESQRHPELSQAGNDSLEFVRSFVASAVKDAVRSGELRADIDVDAAAEMLVASLWGLGFYAGFVGSQERL